MTSSNEPADILTEPTCVSVPASLLVDLILLSRGNTGSSKEARAARRAAYAILDQAGLLPTPSDWWSTADSYAAPIQLTETPAGYSFGIGTSDMKNESKP
jgi:hypothetical protein